MFDLEQAISNWRRRMCAAGIRTPAVLQELEWHLREDIERQVQAGMSEAAALESASAKLGRPELLQAEFRKMERKFMKRLAVTACGALAILVGPALILPALAKHRFTGAWNFDIVWPIAVGVLITLSGVALAVAGVRRRRA
ncbi:MAG TPA: permease prefix domain 1-containing protein [Verrucomicrobiae bacterium]|nr:permease prefix domain 1-containing protein [Verrucomicrobiae bacterium]